MKNPRNDAWQIVNENLKGYYPNWSSNAVQIVTSSLFRRFKDLVNQDTFAVVDIVSEGVLILNKRHSSGIILSNYWLNPGFHLELCRVYDKQKGGLYSVEDGYFNQITQEENINPEENYKNISLYADGIIKGGTLTTKESELFVLLIEISMADLEGEFYKNLNTVAIEIGLTEKDSTFRKTFQRLREKLLDLNNKASLGLISFANQNPIKINTTITDFINYLDSQFIMKNHLQAYRFSEQEMNKMIELKKIFEKNAFKIDRFPEVYIDEEYVLDEKDYPNIDIDKLGSYRFQINNDNSTSEGIIIIYTKAIEIYCSLKSLNSDYVKLIVLMHELGHWLTHFAKFEGTYWEKGYAGIDKKTHESLAQLIAHWSVKGNSELEKTLKHLTPTDSENPYYLYNNLKEINESDILKKLIELRKNWAYEKDKRDQIFYDFLESEYIDFEAFKNKRPGQIAGVDYGI